MHLKTGQQKIHPKKDKQFALKNRSTIYNSLVRKRNTDSLKNRKNIFTEKIGTKKDFSRGPKNSCTQYKK